MCPTNELLVFHHSHIIFSNVQLTEHHFERICISVWVILNYLHYYYMITDHHPVFIEIRNYVQTELLRTRIYDLQRVP